MHRRTVVIGALVTVATVLLAGTQLASARIAKPGTPPTPACSLGKDGKIQHVIYLQFDNVHFLRDNPNVPSDLEQMPHLYKFLKDDGTLDTNDHTVLIAHTGGGILSSLTGLYPDRHGQAVSNSYGFFRPDNSVGFSSSFKYWTDFTDKGNPVAPATPPGDENYNMVNNDPASLGGTGAARNAPAPWVPFTRAGCDVGNVSSANAVLENNTAKAFRGGPTTLTAGTGIGATSINVANRSGFANGQTITIDQDGNAETAVIASGAPASGAGPLTLTAGLTKAHAANVTVYGPNDVDPTGDMTRVFGQGTSEWNEGFDSQVSPAGTARRNKAQTDFVGIAIHCAAGGGICAANQANQANARPDSLPDEAGGYTDAGGPFKALFGAKYVDPAINNGSDSVDDVVNNQPIADQFGQHGFPGFDGMFAKNTLGYVAQMEEAGVPVVYGYISDAHDGHGLAGEIHHAYGPGEAGYVQQLKDYDQAFAAFFERLKKDHITKDNTLFVVTVEEGDHFAGSAPTDPNCDGVTTHCTYANVSEVNADLKKLVATYNVNNGTTATTDFSVHSDLAPNVYINGKPARDSAKARGLEQAMSDLEVTNPYTQEHQNLFVAMADPVEEKLLHMVTADTARTPTFTPFAQGDYFLSASSTTPCTGNDPNACLSTTVTNKDNAFAWNHGGIQPEIRNTWIGWVGPGIENRHETDKVWTDHTDIRPTMLSLLGLKDDYVSDGRVVTDFLTGDAESKSLSEHDGTVRDLGAMWKQINASFGDFSLNTLCASSGALASNAPGDTTYADTENALISLGDQRDTLASKIRLALWNAEFNDQPIDEHQAKDWIKQGQDYLDQAAAMCDSLTSESPQKELGKIKHIVVIYEENHSFDNLFGGWEGVNGLANADSAHTKQVSQSGVAFNCLKQDDVNLTSPPLGTPCTDTTTGTPFSTAFANQPFSIESYIAPDDVTCPKPTVFGPTNGLPKNDAAALPGGCTRDLVHRYYQEQYQLDGGKQDRYATGSDAAGLTMGHFDTQSLPLYTYLHSHDHPDYAISDDFFQAAFGGSFLNHQWLVAAATPVWPGAVNDGSANDLHSALDANGMPSPAGTQVYPLYVSPLALTVLKDQQLTQSCTPAASRPPLQPAFVCGNYAVNTTQPLNEPYSPGTAIAKRLPLQTAPTIGDELTAAGVDWAWYSGGWDNAAGNTTGLGWTNGSGPTCSDPNVLPSANDTPTGSHTSTYPYCPDGLFQFHHQAFNYFANYAPGTPGRAHLQDELNFEDLAQKSDKHDCNLKDVSFIKPLGEENEHPGYASEHTGSDNLVDLLQMIEGSACAKDTMVIVTYDEFGGQWDHVPPPGQGNDDGPHDIWGPGTRIPALVVAPHLKGKFVVDSTEHDTTSILTTIEHRYGLDPLGTRDGAVPDLSSVFDANRPKDVHE